MSGILFEKKGHIAYITIEGRNELNPMTAQIEDELYDVVVAYRDDRDLRVAILTGAGDKAFSVGGDLKPLLTDPSLVTPKGLREQFWWPFSTPFGRIRRLMDLEMDKPIIAAINGYCLGAAFCILVSCTDIRIAAEHAKFGFSETKRGMPSGGAATPLPLQIPHAIAMYMILTGNTIDAQEAYRVGLVNKVVPLAELMPTAEHIANEICEIPPLVIKAEKEGAMASINYPRQTALRLGLAGEVMCLQDEEALHEVSAFMGKSPRAALDEAGGAPSGDGDESGTRGQG